MPNSAHSILLLVLALAVAAPAVAEESAHGGETAAHGESHGWHRHHVGVFVGGAYHEKHEEHGVALELEYEYRPLRHLGGGIAVEHTFDIEGDPWVVVFPLSVHPIGGLRLLTGPAVEFEDDETAFSWRTGIGYDFHVGSNVVITPTFNADWVSGGHWNYTYGVTLGYGF